MTGLSETILYPATGTSQSVDEMGMREMQRRVYAKRDARHILIKSPPASGKSRALMYLALDKLHEQGVGKAIIAVPERSIGGSFMTTHLADAGFSHDWVVQPRNDLCGLGGGERSKVQAFRQFLVSDDPADRVLLCTHATLRFAYDEMGRADAAGQPLDPAFGTQNAFHVHSGYQERLENCLLAIDEFHHSSASDDNRLGEIVRDFVRNGKPHVVAMTGSYFRGDRVPVLRPEDEELFTRIVYTYYEQLSGYEHLKTLGLDYHFYHGDWTNAIGSVLDTTRKTIVHIPSVNSATSTGDKIREVGAVIDVIGEVDRNLTSPNSGIVKVRTPDGRLLTIADLVTEGTQGETLLELRTSRKRDDIDIIIALGMAKEGFDWIWCEHAITVGARGSLTEIVQIIGRTTRDAPGKTHAQFTNLIATPIESQSAVMGSVNDYLKAIAASLLMEQVMAPNFSFRTRAGDDTDAGQHTVGGIDITRIDPAHVPNPIVTVHHLGRPQTERGLQALDNIEELDAAVIMDDRTVVMALNPDVYPPGHFQNVVLRDIVSEKLPGLDDHDVGVLADTLLARQEVRRRMRQQQGLGLTGGVNGEGFGNDQKGVASSGITPMSANGTGGANEGENGGRSILDLTRHLTVDAIDINLIRDINPWRDSYAIRSRELGESALKMIHDVIRSTRITMTPQEAAAQWPRVKEFIATHNRNPEMGSDSPVERRLAEALAKVRQARREAQQTSDQRSRDAVAAGNTAV